MHLLMGLTYFQASHDNYAGISKGHHSAIDEYSPPPPLKQFSMPLVCFILYFPLILPYVQLMMSLARIKLGK